MEDCKTNEILTLQKSLAEKDGVIKQLYALIAKKDESLEKKKKIITKYSQLCMSKATNVRQVSEFVSRYDFQLFDLLVPDLLSKIDALKKKCEDQNSSNEHLKYLEREIERKENIRLRDELLIKQYAQMIEDSKVIQEELRNKQHKQKMVCLQLENKCKDFLKWTRRLGKIIEKHDVPLKKADRNLLCKIQQQSKTKASDVLQSCTFEEEDATNDVESKIFKNQETQTDCLIPNSPIPKHHRKIATYTDGLGILSPSLTSDSGVSLSPVLSLSGLSPLSLNESCTRFKDSIQTYGPYDQEPVPPNLDPKKDIGPTGECHLDMNPASPSTSVFDPELMNNDPLPRDTDLDDGISNEILDDMLNDASEKFNTSVMDELNLSTDNVESSIGVSTDDVVEDNCKVESNESPKHSDIISQEIIYEDNKYVEVIRYQDHFEVLIHSEELDGQNKQCNDGTTYIETDTPSKIKYNVNKLSEEIGEETSKTRNLSTEEPGKSTLLSGKIENVVQILEKSDNTEQAVDEEQSTTSSAIERKSIVENEIAKVDDTEVCEKLKSDDKQIGSITTQISVESNVSSVISNKICFELESLQNHTDISSNYDHSHSAAQDIENDRHLEKMTPFTKEEILDMEIIIADESGKEIEEFESLSAIPDPLSEPTVDSVIKEKLEPEAMQLECPRQDMPTTSSVSLNAVKSVEDSDVSTKNSHDDLVNESENIKSISENISESKSKSTDEINYCLVNNMDEISPKTSHDYLVNVSDIKSISENIPEQKSKLIDENISCLVANKEESTSKTSHDNLVNESENIISSSEKMPQSKSDFTDENNSWLDLLKESENIKSILENKPELKSKVIDENISCLVANKEESTPKTSHDNLMNESENISEKTPQSKLKLTDKNISRIASKKDENTPKTSFSVERQKTAPPKSIFDLIDDSDRDNNNYSPVTVLSPSKCLAFDDDSNSSDVLQQSTHSGSYQNCHPIQFKTPELSKQLSEPDKNSNVNRKIEDKVLDKIMRKMQMKSIFKGPAISPIPPSPKTSREGPSLQKELSMLSSDEEKNSSAIIHHLCVENSTKSMRNAGKPSHTKKHHDLGDERGVPHPSKGETVVQPRTIGAENLLHSAVSNPIPEFNFKKPKSIASPNKLASIRSSKETKRLERVTETSPKCSKQDQSHNNKSLLSPDKLASVPSSKETKLLERAIETSPTCSKPNQSNNKKSSSLGMTTSSNENISTPKHLLGKKIKDLGKRKQVDYLQVSGEKVNSVDGSFKSSTVKLGLESQTLKPFDNLSEPSCLENFKHNDNSIAVEDVNFKLTPELSEGDNSTSFCDSGFIECDVEKLLDDIRGEFYVPDCIDKLTDLVNSSDTMEMNSEQVDVFKETLVAVETSTQVKSCTMDQSPGHIERSEVYPTSSQTKDKIQQIFVPPSSVIDDSEAEVLKKLKDSTLLDDNLIKNSESETSCMINNTSIDESPRRPSPFQGLEENIESLPVSIDYIQEQDEFVIENMKSEISCMINNTRINESPRSPSPLQGLKENIESLPVAIDNLQKQGESDLIGSHLNVIENLKSETSMVNNKSIDESPRSPSPFEKKESETSCMINNTRIDGERITLESIDESPRSPSPFQALVENIESLPVSIDNPQKQDEPDLRGSLLNEQQQNSKQHFPADDTQQCVLNSYVIDNETSQASIKLSDNSGFDVFASNEQVDRIDPSQSIDKIAKSTSESILVRGFGRSRSNSAELHIEIPPVYAYLSDSGVSDFEGWACTSKSKENNIKIPTVSKNLPGDSDSRGLVRASKSPEKRITDPVLSKNLSDSGRSGVRNDQKMEGIQSNDGGGSRKKIKKRNVKTRETVSTPLRRSARLTQISPLGTSCGGDSKQNHSSSSKQKNSEKRIALNELPQSSIVVDKLSPAEILFNKISPTNFSENKYDTQPFMNTRSRSLPARLSHIPQLLNPKKRCLCINCDDYDSKDAPPLKKDKRERVRCVNIDSKKTSALKRSNSVHKINSSPRQMIDSKVSSRRNAGRNMKNENVCERQSRKRISYPFYNSVRRSSRLSLEKMKTSDDQNHRIESVKSDEQNKPSCEEMNGNKEPESSSITSNCISKNSSSLEANRSSPVDSESPPPLFDKNFKYQSSPLNSKFINDVAPSSKHSEAFPSPINSTMMVENIVVDDDDDHDGDLLIDCEEDSKDGNQVHSSTNDEIRSSNCAEMESGVTSMQSDQSSGFTTTACQSLVQRHISVCAIEQSPILRRSPRKSTIIASQCSESRFNLRIDSTPNVIDRSAEVQKQNIEQNCRSADFNDPLRIDSSVPNESTNSQTPNTESIPAFNFYTEVSEASKQADKRKSDPIDIDAKRRKLNDEEESQQCTIPLNTNEVEENVDGLNHLEEEKIRMVPCDNVILLAYHYHRRNLSSGGGLGDSSPDESQLKVFEDQAEEVFIRVAKARLEAKEEKHVEKKKDGEEEEEEYWTCEVLEACLEKLKGIPNDVISDMLVDTLYHDQGYLDSSAAAPVSDLQNKIITIAYKLCSDRPEFFNSLLSSFRVILLENTAETVECYCRYVRCLTLLCRALHKVEEMRWFVYDALYFRIKSGFAMAHTALTMWPSILPMASPIERTSPLALCISHVLSKHSRNLENIKITFYKADKVDALLRTYYGYEEIDKNTVFEHLMKCLHTNVDGALEALVLLCKRIGPKWTFGHVCESLMRILNQWKLKKNNGEAVIRAIRVLSYILRPFMQGTHIIKMNEFLRTIGTFLTDSEADDRIQAVAAESLCRLSRVNMPLCTELLIKWKPRSGKVPLDLIKQMRAFIARKKPVVWLREMQKNNVFNSQGHKSS